MLTLIGAVILAAVVSLVLVLFLLIFVIWIDEKDDDSGVTILIWLFEALIAFVAIWLQRQYLLPAVIQEKGQLAYAMVAFLALAIVVYHSVRTAIDDSSARLIIYGLPAGIALVYAPISLIVTSLR